MKRIQTWLNNIRLTSPSLSDIACKLVSSSQEIIPQHFGYLYIYKTLILSVCMCFPLCIPTIFDRSGQHFGYPRPSPSQDGFWSIRAVGMTTSKGRTKIEISNNIVCGRNMRGEGETKSWHPYDIIGRLKWCHKLEVVNRSNNHVVWLAPEQCNSGIQVGWPKRPLHWNDQS